MIMAVIFSTKNKIFVKFIITYSEWAEVNISNIDIPAYKIMYILPNLDLNLYPAALQSNDPVTFIIIIHNTIHQFKIQCEERKKQHFFSIQHKMLIKHIHNMCTRGILCIIKNNVYLILKTISAKEKRCKLQSVNIERKQKRKKRK